MHSVPINMTDEEEQGVEDTEQPSGPPIEDDGKSDGEAEEEKPVRHSSMLPEVTEEIMALHLAEKEEMARTPSGDGEHKECCGIPYYLGMALLVLGVAVIIGTVLLVIYHDPNDETNSPTSSPTIP
jgi:hypothetical protein